MKVEIKNIESGDLIMVIDNVEDVSNGCCGMMLIQTDTKTYCTKLEMMSL